MSGGRLRKVQVSTRRASQTQSSASKSKAVTGRSLRSRRSSVTEMEAKEARHGVSLTHLDDPLFDGAEATKRDLVDYVDRMADRMVPHLRNRPLSVIRVRAGQPAFMQKNLPKDTPHWVESVSIGAERPRGD